MDWTTFPADAPEPALWRPWSIFGFTDHPRTFLDLLSVPRDARVVVSFHYYDPPLVAGVPFRGRLSRRIPTWPAFFAEMDAQIRGQGATPFLTEFGCDQNWTQPSDFQPEVYGTAARACMDRQYREVEARLFNATYWNFDFYSRRGPDGRPHENWNEENMSLLGPDGPQNLDVASRPYPMRSSARPEPSGSTSRRVRRRSCWGARSWPRRRSSSCRRAPISSGGSRCGPRSQLPAWDPDRGLLYWWPRPGDDATGSSSAPGGGSTRRPCRPSLGSSCRACRPGRSRRASCGPPPPRSRGRPAWRRLTRAKPGKAARAAKATGRRSG